jgi:hypothetical protein
MWEDTPVDIIQVILSQLELPSLAAARAVSRQWSKTARSSAAVLAALRNTSRLQTRAEICQLLGISHAEAIKLPCRPYITRRGLTCWLFSLPDVAEKALELVKARHLQAASVGQKRKPVSCSQQ